MADSVDLKYSFEYMESNSDVDIKGASILAGIINAWKQNESYKQF